MRPSRPEKQPRRPGYVAPTKTKRKPRRKQSTSSERATRFVPSSSHYYGIPKGWEKDYTPQSRPTSNQLSVPHGFTGPINRGTTDDRHDVESPPRDLRSKAPFTKPASPQETAPKKPQAPKKKRNTKSREAEKTSPTNASNFICSDINTVNITHDDENRYGLPPSPLRKTNKRLKLYFNEFKKPYKVQYYF